MATKQGWIAGRDALTATHDANTVKASFETYSVYNAKLMLLIWLRQGLHMIRQADWTKSGTINGYGSWADWRRTGFPVLAATPNGKQPTIPRRQGYPNNEGSINGKSYTEATAR